MTHLIILFRGMNTGGVRGFFSPISSAMARCSPTGARTLQASGNLVVESGKATAALEHDIETAMDKTFGLKVAAMVRTPDQWAKLIAANPFPREAAAHPSKVVAMVMKDGIKAGALEACRELAAAGERVEAVGDVLYFWFPNGQGESAIFKKATPRLLGMGTGRNWNTVLKLGEMVGLSPA